MRRFQAFKPDFLENLRVARQAGNRWTQGHKKSFLEHVYQPCLGFLETLEPCCRGFMVTQVPETEISDCWMGIEKAGDPVSVQTGSPRYAHLCLPKAGEGRSDLCLHFVFSAAGFGLGCGIQELSTHQKEKLKTAVSKEAKTQELESALSIAETGGCFLEKTLSTRQKDQSSNTSYFSSFTGLIIRNRNEPYGPDFHDPAFFDIVEKRVQKLISFENWLATHVL